jgi:hypothetical protein
MRRKGESTTLPRENFTERGIHIRASIFKVHRAKEIRVARSIRFNGIVIFDSNFSYGIPVGLIRRYILESRGSLRDVSCRANHTANRRLV